MTKPIYLQLIRSEIATFLITHYPLAFLVLSLIAQRARRTNGIPDGLIIGDALIGSDDFKRDISRQNFRTALKKLEELKYIKIVSNGKKFFEREKSTINVTIKCHLVNLCSSVIYNINPDDGNQQGNQQVTNSQPTGNHKQERIRKKYKNEKQERLPPNPLASSPQKIKLRDHVQLFQSEYDALLQKRGQEFLDKMLDVLDSYKGSKGVDYKSDYHVMKEGGWVVERVEKELLNKKESYAKTIKFAKNGSQSDESEFRPSRVLGGGSNNAVEGS